jgi:RNA polymerase-binding transcription factor DksA
MERTLFRVTSRNESQDLDSNEIEAVRVQLVSDLKTGYQARGKTWGGLQQERASCYSDGATTAEGHLRTQTMLGHNEAQTRQTLAALQRIESNTYGTCSDCKGFIGRRRLNSNPTATRCHACQSHHEGTIHQNHRGSSTSVDL